MAGKYWNHNLYTIKYCPAPTGAGKTYALETRIHELIEAGQTIILVQPSKDLARQTSQEMTKRFPETHVEVINQDTQTGSVTAYTMRYLQKPYDQPHLIIVTWAGFVRMPKLFNSNQFHLLIDEIPDCFVSENLSLAESHRMITDAIEVEDKGPTYGLIRVKNRGLMRKLAENKKKDASFGLVNKLASRLLHEKYLTYVKIENYEALLKGNKDNLELTTFSMIDSNMFNGFRSVTIAGARAEETILFKWLALIGVSFQLDQEMTDQLRYQAHENGHLIDFYYASEANWSLNQQVSEASIRPLFEAKTLELFGDDSFCWQDNKRHEDKHAFDTAKHAQKLSHSPHGINDLQSINNVVIMTARNYTNEQRAFLAHFCGIGAGDQKIALAYHAAYQAYNRISTRDPSNMHRKIIVLPDRQNAAWQHNLFPGSTLSSLGIDQRQKVELGRKPIHENAAARKQASRDRMKQQEKELMEKMVSAVRSHERLFISEDCHVSTFNNIGHFVTRLQGSLIAHKFEKQSTAIIMPKNEFVAQLRDFSLRSFQSKEEAMLISPALFTHVEGINQERSLANAVVGKNIILDIENGTMKYRDLLRIFPRVEMVLYSSYNHTSLKQRYRAIFLTDQVMSPGFYKILYHQIVQRIEMSGYENGFTSPAQLNSKVHGIDYKPSVSDLFYLPSVPREGKGFFYHHHKGRSPLDVQDWLDHLMPTRFDLEDHCTHEASCERTTVASDHAAVCDRLLQDYRDQTIAPETGNRAMFRLNTALIRNGVDRIDREATLTIAAASSRSPADRMRDVKRLMGRRV
ncbi:DEAD/DEAH box helicase [Methylobacterium sp. WL122]|nr:DEAD/DEAH box helicase [Methylobacterium sp. WL122]